MTKRKSSISAIHTAILGPIMPPAFTMSQTATTFSAGTPPQVQFSEAPGNLPTSMFGQYQTFSPPNASLKPVTLVATANPLIYDILPDNPADYLGPGSQFDLSFFGLTTAAGTALTGPNSFSWTEV